MHVPFDIKGKLMQIWKSTDIFRRVTRGGRGGRSPLPFFKNWEKVPQFWKKMPWLCPSWVKFLISNVVLRVSRRKINIFFPCGAFLSCVVDEMFIDVPWFQENSPALKNSWLLAWVSFCNKQFFSQTQITLSSSTCKRANFFLKVLFEDKIFIFVC